MKPITIIAPSVPIVKLEAQLQFRPIQIKQEASVKIVLPR